MNKSESNIERSLENIEIHVDRMLDRLHTTEDAVGLAITYFKTILNTNDDPKLLANNALEGISAILSDKE